MKAVEELKDGDTIVNGLSIAEPPAFLAAIARNDNMISINSVLEIDLLGQANAEYLAGSQYSGTGEQLDFVRGDFNSRGGKSILAFYSTADGEKCPV